MADRAEQYYLATQWQLMWRKFRRHRLALLGGGVLLVFYLFALLAQFVAPTTPSTRNRELVYAPPQRVRLFHEGRLVGPFIYPFERSIDPLTTQRIYTPNKELVHRIRFFVRGEPYRFWGSLDGDLHLFDAGDGRVFLLGTDELGRDLFSRILAGSRVSLTIGLVGVMISFVLGCLLGGISGYFGGLPDLLIQRLIEIFNSIPGIPLWMALSAVIPVNWPVLRTYFTITLILSVLGWTGVARVVRGKLLELREYDYVTAARLAGTRAGTIIATHLLPGFLSYLIVRLTLAIPGMILGETALSFLGLGIQPPAVSWGTLLRGAQNVTSIAIYPWLLTPALFVIVAVLLYNFVGDGLRDAADPYAMSGRG